MKRTDRSLIITRTFKAPRPLVFEVWTKPEHLKHWWGPTGFTITTQEMNVKPGGFWRLTMHGPDGTDYPNVIQYSEVNPPSFLSWSHGTGAEDDPGRFDVTVAFEEQGNETEITMIMTFMSKEALDLVEEKYGAIEGNRQTLNRLEEYLKTFK